MTTVLMIVGFLMVVFVPYLYFSKASNMNDKTYLLFLTVGAIAIEIGLYLIEKKTPGIYVMMGINLLLILLAGFDAIKALSGKMTKYEKQRLEALRQADAVKAEEAKRNTHFKM